MGAVSISVVDYKTTSDSELVLLAKESDAAYSELISRYLPSIRRLARIYTKSSADRDDLVSEGILGLMSAVRTFSEGKGAGFSTYAGVCVNNRMMTALKKSAIISNREEPIEDISSSAGTIGASDRSSPEKIVLDREALSEIFSEISGNLTGLERSVFDLYLMGASYADITKSLGINAKAVDNALARVRRKLRRRFR